MVIEHDKDTMLAADHLIDIGPGAAFMAGTSLPRDSQEVSAHPTSLTGAYISGRKHPTASIKKKGKRAAPTLKGAKGNNLRSVDVKIPLGMLVCVTGVSGSERVL